MVVAKWLRRVVVAHVNVSSSLTDHPKEGKQMNERFFLARDCSNHWYLVPANKREEWNEWTNIDEDDSRAWQEPEWAKRIGGHPHWITFECPKNETP